MIAARSIVPYRISIDLGNAAVLAGVGIAWMGVRRFETRPVRLSAAFAGAIIWLAACQVPVFYTSLVARVIAIAAIVGIYDLLCACEFLRRRPAGRLPTRRVMAILFLLNAGISGVRLLIAAISGFHHGMFSLPVSHWYGVPMMLNIAVYAGTSVLQIAVAKEAGEQRSNAVLAEARDAADRANLAKSRFLARMSHELRTPLNGLLGMAQVLTRDPQLRGVQRERAVTMEQSGRHLLAIINDILDLASVESGQFQLAPRPSLVSDIVQSSVDLVAETAAARRITLDVTQAPGLPAAVLGDPLRVRQILVNLLGNAIKFTPPEGRVALDVAPLSPGRGLRLSVTDTGPGVPPEFQPHLFHDFARRPVEAGTPVGTGLGLSISASLAAAMGGTIHYEPGENGLGSRFVAALPLPAAEPPAEQYDSRPARQAQTGLHVLVVDDVVSKRRLAEALLQQAGYRVTLAEDGLTCLAALQRDPVPDLVLMDVHMPNMDGMMTARRIRALPGRAGQVPILALTAEASADRAGDYLAAGMNGAVTKPIDFNALIDAIAAVAPPAFSQADAASPPSAPARRRA